MKHGISARKSMAAVLIALSMYGVGHVHAGPASDHAWSQTVGTYVINSNYEWIDGNPALAMSLSDRKPMPMEHVIGFSHGEGVMGYLDIERKAWIQSMIDPDDQYRYVRTGLDVWNGTSGLPMMRDVSVIQCGWNSVMMVTRKGQLFFHPFRSFEDKTYLAAEGVIDAEFAAAPGGFGKDCDHEMYILFSDGKVRVGSVEYQHPLYWVPDTYWEDEVAVNADSLRVVSRFGYEYPIWKPILFSVKEDGELWARWQFGDSPEVSADKGILNGVRRMLNYRFVSPSTCAMVAENRDNSVVVVKMDMVVMGRDGWEAYQPEVIPLSIEGVGVLKGAAWVDNNHVAYLREDGALRMYSLETGQSQIIANRVAQFSKGAFVKQYSGNPIYRYRNKATGSWLFTVSLKEAENVEQSGEWEWECFSHGVPLESDGGNPVHRLFNKISGAHFYTMSETEKNAVLENMPEVFEYEGVAFHAFGYQAQGTLPVYRFYAPKTASHFFTISEEEKDWIVANVPASDLKFEGVAWYAWPW